MVIEALNYLKRGWSIVPVCWPVNGVCGCSRGHSGNSIGKAPLVAWKDYQNRLPTEKEVIQWWTQWPNANMALVTGKLSGVNVVDLEYDGLAHAKRIGLYSSLISITGKGKHLYYAHTEGVCNAAALNGVKGLDIRGEGGYVLLPPSLHATGRKYAWAVNARQRALPSFPISLIQSAQAVEAILESQPSRVIPNPTDWISTALASLGEGNRNDTFARIVGKLHSSRLDRESIRVLLLPHAHRVHFDESELDGVIGSITRYPVTIYSNAGGSASATKTSADRPKLEIKTLDGDWSDYQRRKSGIKNSEFATGYPRLDALIGGGLQREELFTVAAWTGVGKTNFLLGICHALALRGKHVLLLSTEMSKRKIWDRYIPLFESAKEARRCSPSVCDEFVPDPAAIGDAVKEHKPDVLIFDHIHNVSEDFGEVANFMKTLKDICKENEICGVVASQFNKGAMWENDGKKITPGLVHIKGSSAITQVSAQVLLLDEVDDTAEQKNILAILAKNRDGEKGSVSFALKKNPYRMVEI